ncbi:MAG TPA: ectonucleotide pyrophosphatase/phosphodiesterase [Tenuifilaceae bacterium]|nr:ectonucleotide pyrophosphatase/phosphodiesterase [Tenuifilaceae bacterium]
MRVKVLKNSARMFSLHIMAVVVSLVLTVGCTAKSIDKPETYVVVLSLDAFRWDYPTIAKTPNLNSMAKHGVTTKAFIPCYPSKTFPNHYSMATGLHPDHHGIVSNSFYDATLGYYSIGNRKAVENPAFYGGEPIWITAENQGVISASYFWVGSETAIGGKQPTYWKPYDSQTPFTTKIDTVIHWLSLPMEKRPRLIMWYSPEPDGTSHEDGPKGPKTLAMVEQLDSLLGIFLHKLSALPHATQINFIVVSDHGMAEISADRYINLNDYIDRNWFSLITGGNPVFRLQPKEEYRSKAIAALKAIPHLKVWERHGIPQRYHYGTNARVQDILVEAELGYSVGIGKRSLGYSGGTHGYDNQYPDMHGIFFAQGPAFKQGYEHKAIMNNNLYLIIAHILGLNPAETDGDYEEIKDLFK